MSIQLQVVGLFYNAQIDIDPAGKTVKDLMDAAKANPQGAAGSINSAASFNYGTHFDSPGAPATMSLMSALYDGPFTSRVEQNQYPAGLYSLKESFDPQQAKGVYTVWQYYLFDADGKFINRTPPATSFTEQPLDGVAKVTWRLVTILGGPVADVQQMDSIAARNPARRAMGV